MEPADTLAAAEEALKKHQDFVRTMDANQDKVDAALESGRRLADDSGLYAGHARDKMDSIKDRWVPPPRGGQVRSGTGSPSWVPIFRHSRNRSRAQEVSQRLRDNRDLQRFLQNTQDVSSSPPGRRHRRTRR